MTYQKRTKTITGTYTTTDSDNGYRIICNSSSAFTITLHSATGRKNFDLEIINIGEGTVACNGESITQNSHAHVGNNDGASWVIGISSGGGGGGSETDPIFVASPAYGITSEDITNWNSGGGGVLDATYYVSASTGDDDNTGAPYSPFATLGKAISLIPDIINGLFTISLAAGDYTSEGILAIENKYGSGAIRISGSDNPLIDGIACYNVSCDLNFSMVSFMCITQYALDSISTSYVSLSGCVISATVEDCQAIYAEGASMEIYDCEFNNCLVGVSSWNSNVFVSAISGTGNTTLIDSAYGASLTIADSIIADGDIIYPSAKVNYTSEWDSVDMFKLGTYYLWIDSTGALRKKNGKPTSDTDGDLV
jgi:hypothetical protein